MQLLAFRLSAFDPAALQAHSLSMPAEIARAVPKRQAEFLYGRWAAMLALGALDQAPIQLPIGDAREPLWPAGTVGSITHVDGLAAASAASSSRFDGLGIDLERTARGDAQQSLRQVAFNDEELALLAAVPGPLTLDERVTLGFSAKESLYKGAFRLVRRFFGFESARVVQLDMNRQQLTLRLTETLHPRFHLGRHCVIGYQRLERDLFLSCFAEPAGAATTSPQTDQPIRL